MGMEGVDCPMSLVALGKKRNKMNLATDVFDGSIPGTKMR